MLTWIINLFKYMRAGAAAGLLLFLCITMGLTPAGCTGKNAPHELVVYAAGPRELAEFMCKEFEREYGVKTSLFCATTGEIMAKLKAEEFHPHADVVILAGQTAAEVLKQQKSLAPLPAGDYLRLNTAWNDPDGFYAGTAGTALGVAMRKEGYDPNLDWDQIFAGAIKGKLIMPSPSLSGSSAEFVICFHLLFPDKFWKGMENIKNHGLQISGPNSQALTSVVLGGHQAALAAADYLVFKQIEKGEPLVMHFPPSGCPLSLRPVMIMAGSDNKKAAGDFVKLCFSSAVQKEIAAEHLLPADPGVELSKLRKEASVLHPILMDVKTACKEQQDILQRFRTEIEQGGGESAQ